MSRRDLLIGSELAGYRIEALIGRGGMGSVYLAEQITLGRKVALKVLPPDLADSEDFRHRFERESRLAASLDHPHVIPIFESGEADGVLFIAMRLVEGTDLATLIADGGPLALDRAASIVTQVGSALDAAHAKGLVHRDVKPGNVLVVPGEPDEEDYAYLSDFGLTRLTTSDSALTRTGHFMGTVAYAAPEQFQGRPADAASDLYSLGCVAYECVTGERPFPRDQEAAVMFAHLQEEPPHAAVVRPDVPAALDAALVKAMAKAPEDRFPTGKAFGAAVRAAVGIDSTPGSIPVAPPIPPIPDGGGRAGRGPPPTGHPRRRFAVTAALVALAVAAAAIVLFAVGRGPSDQGAPRSSTPAGKGPTSSASTSSGASASPGSSPGAIGPPGGLPVTVDSLLRLDPESGEVLETYAVGSDPGGVAFSGHAVWVVNDGDATISKLDTVSGHVTTRGGIASPCGVFPGPGGRVWVVSCDASQVELIGPDSFDVIRTLHVPGPGEVVTTGGSTWAVSYRGPGVNSMLYRFDSSGRREALIELGFEAFSITVADDGSLWGNDFGDGTIWRVDPATNDVEFIPGWTTPDEVVAGNGKIWVGDPQTNSVTEFDPVRRQVDGVIRLNNKSGYIVVTPDAVWNQSDFSDVLTKAEEATGQILEEFQLDYSSVMTYGDGWLWISAGSD